MANRSSAHDPDIFEHYDPGGIRLLTFRRPAATTNPAPNRGTPSLTPAPHPRRRNGRAALGGLLVTLAALGAFAAATGDVDDGLVGMVVASRDIAPGDRLTRGDLAVVSMRLAPATARRAYRDPAVLVGAVAIAPISAGELVQAGAINADDDGSRQLSFAVDPARALGGRLRPGERVDVLATFGTGVDADTTVVARRAVVVRLDEQDGALGGGGLVVTLAVPTDEIAYAVAHAASAAEITLVRASGTVDTADPPPPAPEAPAPEASAPEAPPATVDAPPTAVPSP